MDAGTCVGLIVFSGAYMVLKIRLTAMKIRHSLYEKGSTTAHIDALARAKADMDPYKGLNDARARMKGSLNAHKDALARAKGGQKYKR